MWVRLSEKDKWRNRKSEREKESRLECNCTCEKCVSECLSVCLSPERFCVVSSTDSSAGSSQPATQNWNHFPLIFILLWIVDTFWRRIWENVMTSSQCHGGYLNSMKEWLDTDLSVWYLDITWYIKLKHV